MIYWSAFLNHFKSDKTHPEEKPGKEVSSLLSNLDLTHLKINR